MLEEKLGLNVWGSFPKVHWNWHWNWTRWPVIPQLAVVSLSIVSGILDLKNCLYLFHRGRTPMGRTVISYLPGYMAGNHVWTKHHERSWTYTKHSCWGSLSFCLCSESQIASLFLRRHSRALQIQKLPLTKVLTDAIALKEQLEILPSQWDMLCLGPPFETGWLIFFQCIFF